MPWTITHVQNPPEQATYEDQTGLVTLTRQYSVVGAFPQSLIGIPYGSLPTNIPLSIEVTVSYTNILGQPDEATVTLYAKSQGIEHRVAPEDEDRALTQIAVVYEGFVVGTFGDDLEIATQSELLVIDLSVANANAAESASPLGIGAQHEGVNRHVPKVTWHIYQNIARADWPSMLTKIACLTGTVNETAWTVSLWPAIQWLEGQWLYLGATFSSLGEWYYRLTHTFDMATETDPAHYHKYRWRWYHDEPAPAPVGGTAAAPTEEQRTIRIYGPEQVSQIYPIAGKANIIADLDLRKYSFQDLDL